MSRLPVTWCARQGLRTVAGAGSPQTRHGLAIHIYACNTSMGDRAIYNRWAAMHLNIK
jgi:homogentisate 1,2-dioxygenase